LVELSDTKRSEGESEEGDVMDRKIVGVPKEPEYILRRKKI
jgi:hypothetical protein